MRTKQRAGAPRNLHRIYTGCRLAARAVRNYYFFSRNNNNDDCIVSFYHRVSHRSSSSAAAAAAAGREVFRVKVAPRR